MRFAADPQTCESAVLRAQQSGREGGASRESTTETDMGDNAGLQSELLTSSLALQWRKSRLRPL